MHIEKTKKNYKLQILISWLIIANYKNTVFPKTDNVIKLMIILLYMDHPIYKYIFLFSMNPIIGRDFIHFVTEKSCIWMPQVTTL